MKNEAGFTPQATVAVVGGMNLDILGVPDSALLPRDSAPGKITLRPGGVGRNIAARLQQLGCRACLITALGADARAEMLKEMCRRDGIDLSLSIQTDEGAPCYLCIHDEQGDMALAVNDMSAMDALTPEALSGRMDRINAADACVLDANLSAGTLSFIARHASVPLILDPVSCFKAPRVLEILPRLTAIKPNRLEAEALTGEKNVERAADKLLSRGVQNVFISLGPEGAYYASRQEKGYVPAHPLPALPQTGAGDALCAGITLALLRGLSPREACQAGCEAAYRALSGKNLS